MVRVNQTGTDRNQPMALPIQPHPSAPCAWHACSLNREIENWWPRHRGLDNLYLVPKFVEDEDEFEAVKSDSLNIGPIKTFDGFIIDMPAGVSYQLIQQTN